MATRTYLTRRSLGTLLLAPYLGGWNETSVGKRLHGQVNWFRRLRTSKTNGGTITSTLVGETNDTPDWDLAVGAWVTDPLDLDQTISGTLDWVLAVNRTDAASEVHWYLHAYVSQGDDPQTVRDTLFSSAVAPDAAFSLTGTFRGPSAPVSLASVNALAGDRVVVILGFRFLNATVADDVTVFDTIARLWQGTTHTNQTVEGADAALGSTSVTTQTGWMEFSDTLTFAAAPAAPANDACADAVVIAALPYHSPRIDTTESADTNRAVWYTYTPAADAILLISGLGSTYELNIRVHQGASCGALTFLGAASSPTVWVQRAQTIRRQAVTAGTTYWFEVRSNDGGGGASVGGGGSLTLHVTEQSETLVDDDLYVDCQHIAVYRGGELIRFSLDFYDLTPTGNAIDYTLRELSVFPASPHIQERLYVGLFGSSPLIEVLDLRTLEEVGYTFSNLDLNENVSSLVFNRVGQVVLGWYGDNYDEIGALSSANACRVRRMDGLDLDSELVPVEAEAFTAAQEVSGSDFVDLAADQDTLYYTSAGRLIKRYSLTSGQLADFATVPVETGPRPGLRSVRLLPPGDGTAGVLVADGINVKRLNSAGVVIQTYTPTPAVRAQDLDKIEFTKDGLHFWVSDQLSTSLFKFNLATGAQEQEIITHLPTGQLSGFSLYLGYRAGVSDTPPPAPGEEPAPAAPPGCPTDFPVDPGGGGNGCPVAFFP